MANVKRRTPRDKVVREEVDRDTLGLDTDDDVTFGSLTVGTNGGQVNAILTGSVTWDPTGSGGTYVARTTTLTVTGARDGDVVIAGLPTAWETFFTLSLDNQWMAWVSADDTVKILFGFDSGDPSEQTVKVMVFQV